MARDPMAEVRDAPLFVVPSMLDRLRAYRDGPKLADLPGPNPSPERERLAVVLEDLSVRLLAGIAAHPTKFWVMQQFQQSLDMVKDEDAETREHVGNELERLMEIVGIASSDGLLTHYLGRT